MVRYEDLSVDPCGFFGGVVKFCGLDYDEDLVKKAVAFSSFARTAAPGGVGRLPGTVAGRAGRVLPPRRDRLVAR